MLCNFIHIYYTTPDGRPSLDGVQRLTALTWMILKLACAPYGNTRRLATLSGLMRLIAATAIEHKLAIVTSNTKHFQSVKTIEIEAFKPR